MIDLNNFIQIYSPNDNLQDYYLIDINGNIFSLCSNIILKHIITENGYSAVSLNTKDNKRIQRKVHRLVMYSFKYFHGCEELQVNHIDGNKLNNNINNLEWVTPKENVNHAINSRLRKSWNGDNNPNSKISEIDALNIANMVLSGFSNNQIINNIPNSNESIISNIILGNTWNYLIDKDIVDKMRSIRYPEIISNYDKHRICKYYQDIKNPLKYYGSTKYYIINCLNHLNIEINDSTYRIAKRLLYKYQDYDIISLYKY